MGFGAQKLGGGQGSRVKSKGLQTYNKKGAAEIEGNWAIGSGGRAGGGQGQGAGARGGQGGGVGFGFGFLGRVQDFQA